MLGSNASPLELTWTVVAIGGAGLALALVVNIWMSYSAVMAWVREGRAVQWGPRHKFALGFLVGMTLLFLVWLGFVALGANAILNPPPSDPMRQAASERAGWILVTLESVLFVFQCILMWAWLSLARPTLYPADAEPNSPAALLFRAIDLGRNMGHGVANKAVLPYSVLEEVALDESLPTALRTRATEGLAAFDELLEMTRTLHEAIKRQEQAP